MKKIIAAAGGLGGVLLVFLIWQKCFPSDEMILRRQLKELARAASIPSHEGNWGRLARANKVVGFFSPDVVISLAGVTAEISQLQGRDQLRQAVLAAQVSLQQAQVEFPDILVKIGADGGSAVADLTVLADLDGEKGAVVQELRFTLQKRDGRWTITRVDPIETLRR